MQFFTINNICSTLQINKFIFPVLKTHSAYILSPKKAYINGKQYDDISHHVRYSSSNKLLSNPVSSSGYFLIVNKHRS